MNKLDAFCEAIMKFEGWRPGSVSYRNSNPGNLRSSPIQAGTRDGYAYFDNFKTGWMALVSDVRCKATGMTRTSLDADSTIEEFFQVYAPSADGNHPRAYAEYVCHRTGMALTDRIGSLVEEV